MKITTLLDAAGPVLLRRDLAPDAQRTLESAHRTGLVTRVLPGTYLPTAAAEDLVPELGGDVIDTCLRSRRAGLDDLWTAFREHSDRRGNAERRRMLIDSRDEPWSEAERLAHRLLRHHRIPGWQANLKVRVRGARYFIDIAFKEIRLAIEIDGRLHETAPEIFQNDRLRQNALVGEGWTVLRFTYEMLVDDPSYVIREIVAALHRAGVR